MRRVSSAIALGVLVFTLAAPTAFAATRSKDDPSGRNVSPIVKILKKLARMLGDELVEPKP